MGIAEKAAPAQALPKSRFIVLYGEPGVGKTCLAASGPESLVMDFEKGGVASLLQVPGLENVMTIRFNKVEDIDDVIKEHRAGKISFQTYVVDSVSELQKIDLDRIEDSGAGSKDFRQDAKLSNNKIRRRLLELKDLHVNVVVTCHAIVSQNEITSLDNVRPAVTPGLSGSLLAMADLLGYLEVDSKGNRKVTTTPTRRIQAKNRMGLPQVIENPTWALITGAKS
jgi:phage nucleotide-binding protein